MQDYYKIPKENEKYNFSESDSFRVMIEKDGFLYVEVNSAKPKESWIKISEEEFESKFPQQPKNPNPEQVQAQQLLELQKLNSKGDMMNKALSALLLGMQKGGK